jgi:O-antigen/teichoic acid export membrane protein
MVETTKLVATLGVAVLIPIAAHNERFVELWIGSSHYAGNAITITVACNAFLLGLVTLWGWAFGGTGKVAALVPVNIVATSINLAVSVIFTLKLGLVGPLLGTLSATLLTSAWYVPVLLRRTFAVPLADIGRAIVTPVAWGVPYALAVWWIAANTPGIGWIGLAGQMGAAVALYMSVAWMMVLDASERAVYAGRIRTLLGGS